MIGDSPNKRIEGQSPAL